jgi:hypothetical protein
MSEARSHALNKMNTEIRDLASLHSNVCLLYVYFFGRILPLLPTPSATHPAIKHSPPNGVTGPAILPKRCGSSTSRYRLPENIVMPAVKSAAATRFCGAAEVARRRTPEWMSC